MYLTIFYMRNSTYLFRIFRRKYSSHAAVMGVFQTDKGSHGEQDIFQADCPLNRLCVYLPLFVIGYGSHHNAGKRRCPANLIPENMGFTPQDNLVTGVGMGKDRNKIAQEIQEEASVGALAVAIDIDLQRGQNRG